MHSSIPINHWPTAEKHRANQSFHHLVTYLQTIGLISYLSPSSAVFFPPSLYYHLGQRGERLINSTPPIKRGQLRILPVRWVPVPRGSRKFLSYRERDVIVVLSLTRFRLDRLRVAVPCQRPNPFRRDNFPGGWIRADRILRSCWASRQREGKERSRRRTGLRLKFASLGSWKVRKPLWRWRNR